LDGSVRVEGSEVGVGAARDGSDVDVGGTREGNDVGKFASGIGWLSSGRVGAIEVAVSDARVGKPSMPERPSILGITSAEGSKGAPFAEDTGNRDGRGPSEVVGVPGSKLISILIGGRLSDGNWLMSIGLMSMAVMSSGSLTSGRPAGNVREAGSVGSGGRSTVAVDSSCSSFTRFTTWPDSAAGE
jgi:hypothetical protein